MAALQNQTYANAGYGYYIQSGIPNNPSTMTALNGPVEILFTSSIKGDYYGELNQTPSTFTISENLSANFSTINFITMDPDPLNPKIIMGINDIVNPFPSIPIIQQWTQPSTIVNGVFKVGTKQLNNEPNALVMYNQGNTATIQRNNVLQKIDGVNERTRFTNATIDPIQYTEIGGSSSSAGTVKCANDGNFTNVIIDPAKISYNAANNGKAITGVNGSAPYQYYTSSKNAIEFLVDDVGAVITSLALNKDGTNTMPSTLYVPYIQQGNVIQTIDGANTRTRFANLTDATSYVEINEIPTAPSLIVLNAGAQMKITPSTIAVSNFLASPTQVAKIGTIPSFPNTFMLESYHDTQIRTNINGYSTATFKEDGNIELLSTLIVPYISTTDLVTTSISLQTAAISSISNPSGPGVSIQSLTSLSSINGYPISQFFLHPGMMMPWTKFTATPPQGWLICDGGEYSIFFYNFLYGVIGTTYGTANPGFFRVPDMRGRASMGSVATSENMNQAGTTTCTVNVTNVIDVTTPANWPAGAGLLLKAYYCDSVLGIPYLSMVNTNSSFDGSIQAVIYLENTPTVVIVMGATTYPTVFPSIQTLGYTLNSQTLNAPSVGNSDSFVMGNNNFGRGIYPQPVSQYEVPNHQHSGRTGGNQVSAPGTTRTEPANGDTGVNNGLWTVQGVQQASGLKSIIPNTATWFIIKT